MSIRTENRIPVVVGITGHRSIKKQDETALAGAVQAAEPYRPAVRWWGAIYGNDTPIGAAGKLFFAQWSRENMPADIECLYESDPVPQHKCTLRVNFVRDRFSEDRCQHRPEAVLRMPVVEILRPGLHGRKASQDQDPAVPVIHRAEAVILPFQGGSRRSFPRMNRSGHCCARFRSYFFSNAFHQQIFLIQPSGPSILPC